MNSIINNESVACIERGVWRGVLVLGGLILNCEGVGGGEGDLRRLGIFPAANKTAAAAWQPSQPAAFTTG